MEKTKNDQWLVRDLLVHSHIGSSQVGWKDFVSFPHPHGPLTPGTRCIPGGSTPANGTRLRGYRIVWGDCVAPEQDDFSTGGPHWVTVPRLYARGRPHEYPAPVLTTLARIQFPTKSHVGYGGTDHKGDDGSALGIDLSRPRSLNIEAYHH